MSVHEVSIIPRTVGREAGFRESDFTRFLDGLKERRVIRYSYRNKVARGRGRWDGDGDGDRDGDGGMGDGEGMGNGEGMG